MNWLEQLQALYGGKLSVSAAKKLFGRSKSHANGRLNKSTQRRKKNRQMKRENKKRNKQRREQCRRGR
jgi:hypothetical protein